MSGLVFLKTKNIDLIREFYVNRIGMELWCDQGQCIILRHGNFLLGFCEGGIEPVSPCITFFYSKKKDVDKMHDILQDISTSAPVENVKFNIYHFWAKDPEDRTLEIQHFNDPSLTV